MRCIDLNVIHSHLRVLDIKRKLQFTQKFIGFKYFSGYENHP
jgi:hypothetical protein